METVNAVGRFPVGTIGELYFDPYCATGMVPLEVTDEEGVVRRCAFYWKHVRCLSPLEELALAADD